MCVNMSRVFALLLLTLQPYRQLHAAMKGYLQI